MSRISNSNNNRSWCFVRANNVHTKNEKRKKPAREIQMDLLLAVLNVISLSCRAVLISRFSHKSSVSLPRLDYLCLCTMECYCNGPRSPNTTQLHHRTPPPTQSLLGHVAVCSSSFALLDPYSSCIWL
jgi:hypothetical protein